MKNLLSMFMVTSITLSPSSSGKDDILRQECNKIQVQTSESITPYEFTTITGPIDTKNKIYPIAFYNMDYEYNTISILYALKYDGDILGETKAWFLNTKEKLYISDAKYVKASDDGDEVLIEYNDRLGHNCSQKLILR